MNGQKYLIYVDILGFTDLLKDIGNERGIESRKVRTDFISVIEERLEEIKQKDRILEMIPYEGDSWILVTDARDKVFLSILELLDHNTGYKDYEKIPLEFGIGTGKFDKWAKFDGRHLTCEDEAIKWLRTYIINHYHDWYKQKHNNEPPKSTFIILTESAYNELEHLDRKICQKIEHKYKKDDREVVITFFAADVDKVQQRGRVFEFLEKIGYAGSKWYGRIDEVYVPPLEYEDMARTLKGKRFLFITGTQEYGKTYTAVRLMWEYYNSGYVPVWIKGGEPAERIEVRRKLEDIRAELKPRHIIYFEDPFGKTKYERREGLEREIGTIIDTVKQVEDVYVIITSREEVFKEFEKEKISAKDLKEFEKKLNIKKPSYDYEKRKEILLKWAEEENCKWLGNQKSKELVLNSIKTENILPTLLSIKDFAVATFDIEEKSELSEKIKEKSKESAKAFAKEIKNMSEDKILFLSFPFISDHFKVEFVGASYQELVKELNFRKAWDFDTVLNWFNDDKINVKGKYIEFSHSSYSEAFESLLVEEDIAKDVFIAVLHKLSVMDSAAESVARAVRNHFDKLPEKSRNDLLLKLAEKSKYSGAVMMTVADNFDKLPKDVKNDLLQKFFEKGIVRRVHHEDCKKYSLNVDYTIKKNLKDQEHQLSKSYLVEDRGDICSIIRFSEIYLSNYKGLLILGLATANEKCGHNYAAKLLKLIYYYMFYNDFDFIVAYVSDNDDNIESLKRKGYVVTTETGQDPYYGKLRKVAIINEMKDKRRQTAIKKFLCGFTWNGN